MKKKEGKEALERIGRVYVVKEITGGFEITDESGAIYKITSESPIHIEQTCLPDPDYGD